MGKVPDQKDGTPLGLDLPGRIPGIVLSNERQ
jgi:hypothetical protein